MKLKDKLFIDMIILAKYALEEMTEEEIQENYGSDYYHWLKKYIRLQFRKIK